MLMMMMMMMILLRFGLSRRFYMGEKGRGIGLRSGLLLQEEEGGVQEACDPESVGGEMRELLPRDSDFRCIGR